MADPVPAVQPPAVLVQEASRKVVALGEMPANTPESKAAVNDIMALLLKIAQAVQTSGILPDSWQKITALVVVVLGLIAGSGFLGRWSAPAGDPAIVAKLDQILAKLGVPTPVVPVEPVKPPSPVPVVAPLKVIIYRTPATDAAEVSVAKLPAGAVVDAKVYEAGSSYPWQDKAVALPCMAVVRDGVVLDVQPFATAAGAEALLGVWAGK